MATGQALVKGGEGIFNGQAVQAVQNIHDAPSGALTNAVTQDVKASLKQGFENAKTPEGFGKNIGGALPLLAGATAPEAQGGRLGNATTRQQVSDIADTMESRGWTVTGGGGKAPEEYIPGPGGAKKGSAYPDITATKDGNTLRVNTVDTRADGVTPTTREANNAAKIRSLKPDDHLLLIPKAQAPPTPAVTARQTAAATAAVLPPPPPPPPKPSN